MLIWGRFGCDWRSLRVHKCGGIVIRVDFKLSNLDDVVTATTSSIIVAIEENKGCGCSLPYLLLHGSARCQMVARGYCNLIPKYW